MAKTYRSQDDDDDARNILKDGERMRVPMYAMDALSRDVAQHFARVTDATGDGGLGLHRPGFRISSTITRDRSIYDAYNAEVASAYKNAGAVESEVCGQREGDSFTAKSDQGRDGSADSKLSDAMRDEREAAHQEYQNRIQNAWRTGR